MQPQKPLEDLQWVDLVAESCAAGGIVKRARAQIIPILEEVEGCENMGELKARLIQLRRLIGALLGQISEGAFIDDDDLIEAEHQESERLGAYLGTAPRPKAALLTIHQNLFELIASPQGGHNQFLYETLKGEAREVKEYLEEGPVDSGPGDGKRSSKKRVGKEQGELKREDPIIVLQQGGVEIEGNGSAKKRQHETASSLGYLRAEKLRSTARVASDSLSALKRQGLPPREVLTRVTNLIDILLGKRCFNIVLLAQSLDLVGSYCKTLTRTPELQIFIRRMLDQLPRRINEIQKQEFFLILRGLRMLRYDQYRSELQVMQEKVLEMDDSSHAKMDVDVLMLLVAESTRLGRRCADPRSAEDSCEVLYPRIRDRLADGQEVLTPRNMAVLLEAVLDSPLADSSDETFFIEKVVEIVPLCDNDRDIFTITKLMIKLKKKKPQLGRSMEVKLKAIIPTLRLSALTQLLSTFSSEAYKCDLLFPDLARAILEKFKTEKKPEDAARVVQSIAVLGYVQGPGGSLLLAAIQVATEIINELPLSCLTAILWSAAILGIERDAKIAPFITKAKQLLGQESQEISGLKQANCLQLYHFHLKTEMLPEIMPIFERRRDRILAGNRPNPSPLEVHIGRIFEREVKKDTRWTMTRGVSFVGFELDIVLTRNDETRGQVKIDVELDGPSHSVTVLVNRFRDKILTNPKVGGFSRVVRVPFTELNVPGTSSIDESVLKDKIRAILAL